jgi:hypothetical protein
LESIDFPNITSQPATVEPLFEEQIKPAVILKFNEMFDELKVYRFDLE